VSQDYYDKNSNNLAIGCDDDNSFDTSALTCDGSYYFFVCNYFCYLLPNLPPPNYKAVIKFQAFLNFEKGVNFYFHYKSLTFFIKLRKSLKLN